MATWPRIIRINGMRFRDVTNSTASGAVMSYREAFYYSLGRCVAFGSLPKKIAKKALGGE